MTTQKIEDFLTKQLFISKNIVTYRSLSREFGINVNIAKNELAAFHNKSTKFPDQVCSATYLISGKYPPVENDNDDKTKSNGDFGDMDIDIEPSPYEFTPTPTQTRTDTRSPVKNFGFADGSEREKGDMVIQIRLTVVSEARLEDAKAKYAQVNSVHVYSLSPAPLRDADLLCEPTRRVREMDNQKGVEMAKAVGRIIGEGVEMKVDGAKPKGQSRATATTTTKASLAAPKLKTGSSAPTAAAATASLKAEEKGEETSKDELKKPKQTGKPNFFAPRPQAQAKEKEKASSTKDTEVKGKMFFGAASSSKSTVTALGKDKEPVPVPPPPPLVKKTRSKEIETVKRGMKRKSTAGFLTDEEDTAKPDSVAPSEAPSRQSSNPSSTRSSPQPARAMSKLRLQKNTIVSDEDEDEEQPRKVVKKPRRKITHMSDEEDTRNSEAAEEATRALKSMMDIDDDQVQKVSRKKVGSLRHEEEEEEEATEPERNASVVINENEDVDMSDDTATKPKPKPRKKKEKKKVAPVGRNGVKKRRIMKSRTHVDEKGWMVTQDYSSYESVGEEEEEEEEKEPKKAASAREGHDSKRAAGGKKEKDEVAESTALEDTAVSAPTTNSGLKSKTTGKAASTSAKPSTNKSATAKGGQKQKTLNTFFGLPKAKK